jgi:3,4-dihydroxy 2-butanone 4-phosphate synthase/GTP cyclohydrolase II
MEEAVAELRSGRILLITNEDDSPEGSVYLIAAAEGATPDLLGHMMKIAGGVPVLAVGYGEVRHAQIPSQLSDCFVLGARPEARGSSPATSVFPLPSSRHGVLSHPGPSECIIDLIRLAGLTGCGFTCKLMPSSEWTAMNLYAKEVAKKHHLKFFRVTDLVRHRLSTETHVKCATTLPLRTHYGTFQVSLFESDIFGSFVVLTKGTPAQFRERPPLVRFESACGRSGACLSLLSYLSESFHNALDLMYHDGLGIVVYIPSEIDASLEELSRLSTMTFFQDDPLGTLEGSEWRALIVGGLCSQILRQLSATHIRVVSNRPHRLAPLKEYGIGIVDWARPMIGLAVEAKT